MTPIVQELLQAVCRVEACLQTQKTLCPADSLVSEKPDAFNFLRHVIRKKGKGYQNRAPSLLEPRVSF